MYKAAGAQAVRELTVRIRIPFGVAAPLITLPACGEKSKKNGRTLTRTRP
jgi:hypothetical protein